jgi:prophage regulatory protein
MDKLSELQCLRLRQIIGDPQSVPPIEPLIPVSRSTWWQGVRDGRFPAPIKLGNRITAWRAKDILNLISNSDFREKL